VTRAQRSKRCVSDLCEITSSKRIFAADYQTEGVPFFRGKEITEKYNGAIEVSTELFIERSKFEEIKAKSGAPMPGDLLLTSVGTLGSTYVVRRGDEFYFKDGNITWFRNFRGLDSTYFNYWLTAPDGCAELKKCTIGSSQSAYTIVLLKSMEIDLPSMPEQRRIASILSAYDDLIENNTRRIVILEEMARRIYEEWFVRFRFPGHEGMRMVESELGSVPQGWAIVRLDDVLVLQRGFDLPKQDRTDGSFPIISATGANATHHEYKVKGPGVVTGRSGSLGTVMYVEGDFWPLNTTLWVKQFVVGSALYAFYVLQSIDLVGFNSGAAVPTLNRNDVHGLPVVQPAPDVLAAFDNVVGPMMRLARRLELANANLRTTRDLLLPKLISGELDVSTLQEHEAVAA
jgi:type I restriction enzyme S subunit